MHYTLLFYFDGQGFAGRKDPETMKKYQEVWRPYRTALEEAGVVVAGSGLDAPSTARTLRVRENKTQVQDGPFPETKEQLGGFIVINVPTLDAALDWAARCPIAAHGCVEVRPEIIANPCS